LANVPANAYALSDKTPHLLSLFAAADKLHLLLDRAYRSSG
jgi:hypothetical protein